MKTLIILPTYNERETLPVVLQRVLLLEQTDVLVIDDNSPDGTRDIVRELQGSHSNLHMIEREGKLGLGTAYIAGFQWGLKRGYDTMMEMDSDMSHNPLDVPRFVEQIKDGADLVIGSRYLGGTISVVGWDFKRLLLSKFGNIYASTILGSRISDMTSGFRAYSRKALMRLNLDAIHAEGYAFQIEMAWLVGRAGLEVREISIVFSERATGVSKMSKSIVREAIWLPWKLRLKKPMFLVKESGEEPLTSGTPSVNEGEAAEKR